jgi:hypothetical protein
MKVLKSTDNQKKKTYGMTIRERSRQGFVGEGTFPVNFIKK